MKKLFFVCSHFFFFNDCKFWSDDDFSAAAASISRYLVYLDSFIAASLILFDLSVCEEVHTLRPRARKGEVRCL